MKVVRDFVHEVLEGLLATRHYLECADSK